MSHHYVTKRPQSEARRQHIYGELSGKFNSPALKFVGSVCLVGLTIGAWALVFAFVGG